MPLSSTAIANLALRRIGIQQTIADLTENSGPARACNAFYAHVLEIALRERPWPFAQRWVDLALVSENPTPDHQYSYRYPAGFLSVNRLVQIGESTAYARYPYAPSDPYENQERYLTNPYQISTDDSGRLIFCNIVSARVQGTYSVIDTTLFDPLFADALSWRLASEGAAGLTKDAAIQQGAMASYDLAVGKAFAATLNETKPEMEMEAASIRARD